MTDLKTRLAQATKGSRELSDRVLVAMGWQIRTDYANDEQPTYWWPDGIMYEGFHHPDPTRSVDHVLALVPEGWHLSHAWKNDEQAGFNLTKQLGIHANALAATLPLAGCIAILEAQEADNG